MTTHLLNWLGAFRKVVKHRRVLDQDTVPYVLVARPGEKQIKQHGVLRLRLRIAYPPDAARLTLSPLTTILLADEGKLATVTELTPQIAERVITQERA